MNKVKKIEEFIWREGSYWGKSVYNGEKAFYYRFPRISARPKVEAEKYRLFKKRNVWTKLMEIGIKRMHPQLHFRAFVNWSYRLYGNPQLAIKGAKNQAKSNMINLLTAVKLARKKRVIMFCDLNLEAKHLAPHGMFDKDGVFCPFPIEIWIPINYEFKRVDYPIWDYYSNVTLRRYKNVDEIVDSTKGGKLTVIYTDCFDQMNLIKLTYELVLILAEKVSRTISFYLVHHELHKLFKQMGDKGTSKLMDKLADEFADFRKHNIGLISGYHLGSEVHYRFAQKFILIINKLPPNRKTLTPAEKDAQNYKINEFNIEIAGYYRKHEYSYYPELPRWLFRLIPQREKISYPAFTPISEENEDTKEPTVKKRDLKIYQAIKEGSSYGEVAQRLSISKSTAHAGYKRIAEVLE